MSLSIIVATSENGVIGDGNKMLWHIPEDFKYFKATTMGAPIIMGRKTFESIGRPLPGRKNIVITRNAGWKAEGVTIAPSLEDAIKMADNSGWIIGGAQIYAQALQFATSVYLTLIHKVYTGDAHFPALDPKVWQEVSRKKGTDCATLGLDYDFIVLRKIEA